MTTQQFYNKSIDNDYTNKSLYGIADSARYALTGYYIFVVLSSTLGDSIILVASIKYNALRLHSFIVVVIQHIAASDLLVTLTYVLPKVIAKAADGWLLGAELCFFTAYSTYYFSLVSLLFICTLVTSKLFLVKSPQHRRKLSSRSAHVICGAVWGISFIVPAMFFIVDKGDVSFDFRTNVCSYHFSSPRWKLLKPLQAFVFMVVPNCVVVMTTVALLIYLVKARKLSGRVGGERRWQGIILSILTAFVYCISVTPYAVYRMAESSITHPFFHNDFLRLSGVCLSLNTISNFYIYTLTVPSFRRFLKLLFLRCAPDNFKSSRNLSCTLGELNVFYPNILYQSFNYWWSMIEYDHEVQR